MKEREIIRYSEAFKLEVLKELENGFMSKKELSDRYGIKGTETLTNWARKYGKESLINRVIRVEKPNERDRLKELKKENQKLKDALASAYLKQITAENFLEVVSEMMGTSVAELKKKLGEK